jgi:hypothetical protein
MYMPVTDVQQADAACSYRLHDCLMEWWHDVSMIYRVVYICTYRLAASVHQRKLMLWMTDVYSQIDLCIMQ